MSARVDLVALIETCTNAHIPLLKHLHARAWAHHDLKVQIAAMKRLQELGAHTPPRPPTIIIAYDADQRDFDDEALAHGVSVSQILKV